MMCLNNVFRCKMFELLFLILFLMIIVGLTRLKCNFFLMDLYLKAYLKVVWYKVLVRLLKT